MTFAELEDQLQKSKLEGTETALLRFPTHLQITYVDLMLALSQIKKAFLLIETGLDTPNAHRAEGVLFYILREAAKQGVGKIG